MENLLSEIAENNQKGLQLITLHTGAGKSHAMKEMIFQHTLRHKNDDNPRKILVVTSQKKNLPKDDLLEVFRRHGCEVLFYDSYLYLDSISNIVIESFDDSLEALIIESMGRNKVVTDFIQCIKDIKAILRSSPNHVEQIKKRFSRDEEPAFRKRLRGILSKTGKDYDHRFKYVMTHKEWSWVPILYPSIYTKYRRIFVMSADKFVLQNDTIIGSVSTIYESQWIEGSIIFIDEFDATKGQIMKRLIEKSLNRRIYYIDLFTNVLRGLSQTDNFPTDFFKKAKNSKQEKDLKVIVKENLDEFSEVNKTYRLSINKKVTEDYFEEGSDFIFQSYSTILISDAHKTVGFTFDSENNIDMISFDSENDNDLLKMFSAMRHCISMFCGLVKLLAINYQKAKGDPGFSFEDSISSVLDQFRITNPEEKSYLMEDVLAKSHTNRKRGVLESSVYDRGYRYFMFDDNRRTDLRTRVMMVSQDITPEKILASICSRGLVIGMSATAAIRSPISNYDLSYVESCLEGGLLPSVDRDPRIQQRVQSVRANYPDDMIDVNLVPEVGIKKYSMSSWNLVFSSDELAFHAYDIVGKDEHNALRYLKMALVFKDFMSNDGHALLCFNNKLPAPHDEKFDSQILKDLFGMIVDELRLSGKSIDYSFDENVLMIKSADYDAKKKFMIDQLSNHKKMFVMTTYNTLGAGQNIQYPRFGYECINVSDYKDDDEMDFDSVYCELPRFIIPKPESWDDIKEMLELIFYYNFLYEVGDFSKKQCDESVRAVLTLKDKNDHHRNRALTTVSANRAMVSRIIQAVGRLSRTNMKHHKIRIYLDNELSGRFLESVDSYGVLSKESEAIIKKMATSDSTYEKNRFLMKARKSSFVSLSVINRLLNEVWQTTNRIEEWKGIREQTITHPTSMIRDDISHNLYVELPEVSDRYWYKTDDDFRTIEISFEKKPGFSEVSSDAARFGELSTIPGVKEGVFDKMNIPISFEMGRFIVSPPLFKNIIKGAIGEYVGTFLLESVGIHVSDMPDDQFERFDGQLAPGIFVDFKHWVSSSFTTRDEQLEKIREKLKEVGGGKVFIINILGSSSDLRPVTVDGEDVIEVPYLYDTVRNEFNETALKMIKEVII